MLCTKTLYEGRINPQKSMLPTTVQIIRSQNSTSIEILYVLNLDYWLHAICPVALCSRRPPPGYSYRGKLLASEDLFGVLNDTGRSYKSVDSKATRRLLFDYFSTRFHNASPPPPPLAVAMVSSAEIQPSTQSVSTKVDVHLPDVRF